MALSRVDRPFLLGLSLLGGGYILLIVLMLGADFFYAGPLDLLRALADKNIQFSIKLSLATSMIAALLSLLVAVPLGYLLSRRRFPGRALVDALVDIPIVLPPLVVGLSLLILFQTAPARWFERTFFNVTYAVPSVILAQFAVSAAFAVRTMKTAFDQIPPRTEDVALTLGCTRAQAFFRVTLPEARRGMLAAGTLAWARALGEFGPVLVFSGATRMRTEVLSTTVFLELSVGQLKSAVAVSLLMILLAVIVILAVRRAGVPRP